MAEPAPKRSITEGRPTVIGDDAGPKPPFPWCVSGPVQHGFKRGSTELGIPTANIPVPEDWPEGIKAGIYFGYSRLCSADAAQKPVTYPAVLSIGTNPYFKTSEESSEGKTKDQLYTFEVHLMHDFKGRLFYGENLDVLVMGYIRDERGDYQGLDELIEDIKFDMHVADNSLAREQWSKYESNTWESR